MTPGAMLTDVVRVPRIRGREAWALADTEYRRFAELVATLADADWGCPTDCTGWTVRDLCLHVLGSMQAQASPAELVHQFRRGLPLNKRIGAHHWVDGLNEIQLRDRRQLSRPDIVRSLRDSAAAAVRARRRTPPPVRWIPIPFGPPVGWKPLSYLLRVGFTRDVWMHRMDLARALDAGPLLTAGHDGRIVADITAEWAGTHREPFDLMLTGAAGGGYRQGSGAAEYELDAIEFCRILSGRDTGTGVLAHPLPL